MVYCNVTLFCNCQNEIMNIDKFIKQCDGDKDNLKMGLSIAEFLIDKTEKEKMVAYEDWAYEDDEKDIELLKGICERLKEEIAK